MPRANFKTFKDIKVPWNQEIDLFKMKFTTRLIAERALGRGWGVRSFETNPAILLLQIPGREKPLKIFSASPPQMAYSAVKIAKDKYITNQLLSDAGLPVPGELLLSGTSKQPEDIEKVEEFLKTHPKIVVKPLDSAHGKGITVNVGDIDHFKRAIDIAAEHSLRGRILVQEQIDGFDVRTVCINYKFADSMSRSPAAVTGDGEHTVEQLIDITNSSAERGENYKARLNIIPKDKVLQFMGKEDMEEVPDAGIVVNVMGISNIGTGGERQNVKHDIPAFLREMSEQASRILDLPVSGVDFLVASEPRAGSTKEELKPYIIEVNDCPSLTVYEDLHSPEQNELIDTYLDFVAQY